MRSTADDLGAAGFDFDHGFGVVGGCELYRRFRPRISIDICKRYPWLCKPRPIPVDVCKRFPEICRGILPKKIPPIPSSEQTQITSTTDMAVETEIGELEDIDLADLLEAMWQAGYYDGQQVAIGEGAKTIRSGCDASTTKQ